MNENHWLEAGRVGSIVLIAAVLIAQNSWGAEVMRQDAWVTINEFGKSKAMIRESEIERDETLVKVPVRYVLDPPGTDKRNGRAVAEWILIEEYDLEKSMFRVHRWALIYVDGESGELMVEPQWKPATGGNEKTLLYLRGDAQIRR
jgi:hypothetical protein